jgi:dihydroneopterin aldolase
MEKPRALLETLAMELIQQVHLKFEEVKHAEIEITKLHLPIEKFSGTATVKYGKSF